MNIEAKDREFCLTYAFRCNEPLEHPEGSGWYLRGMSAEGPGSTGEDEGGVWLLWCRHSGWRSDDETAEKAAAAALQGGGAP